MNNIAGRELTQPEKDMLKHSWEILQDLGVEAVGLLWFKRIFEVAPDLRQLFHLKREQDIYQSRAVKSHGVKVFSTLGLAVAGVEDMESLVPMLQSIAVRHHVNKGLTWEHFDIFGQALLDTLEARLDDAFTDHVKDVWLAFFELVKNAMLEAATSLT